MSEHKPNLVVILMSVIFLALTLFGCSTVIGKRGAEQKIAFLHIGPIGDYGWTYEGHSGAQEMAQDRKKSGVKSALDSCMIKCYGL